MNATLRILIMITAFAFVSCGGNSAGPEEAPATSSTPVAPAAAEPQAAQDITANAPAPVAVDGTSPDRDAVLTPDKPVIEGRDLPAPKEPTPATTTSPTPTAPRTERDLGPAPAPVPAPVPEPEPDAAAVESAPEVAEQPREIVAISPDHKPWETLLQKYVDANGLVDYASWQKDQSKLDVYLATLAANPPLALWSHNERLAYWINAYNAFTIKLILKNYPINSITDLDGGDPWKVKWINIGDKTYSLNNIEHDIIRPRFGDSRIHFAVVCAAKSCPPLLNRAFDPEVLNLQLDVVTRKFINHSKYNQVNGDIRISKIFDWYREDFGNLTDYLNRYLSKAVPADKAIGFMDYDWSLNEQ